MRERGSMLGAVARSAVVLVLSTAACRSTTPAGQGAPIGAAAIAPERVAPEYREDLRAVQSAQQADPAGAAVVQAADRLLGRDPPYNLRLAAVHAKVGHAYLNGDDAIAIRWADEILGAGASAEAAGDAAEAGIVADLKRLRALLHARSGDPAFALTALDEAERARAITPGDLWAGRALASERAGSAAHAVHALGMWRSEVADGSPEARYIESRLAALATTAPDALRRVAARSPGTPAALCMAIMAGDSPVAAEPSWITACAPRKVRVGVLLPRSGKLAAFADEQLAAAIAAAPILAAQSPGMELLWADAGSTAETTRAGASALLEAGASVVVGPLGAAGVTAARSVLGAEAMIVPGEGSGGVFGVAPTLEARIGALVAHARGERAKGLVILAPAHGYGKRATEAARRAAAESGIAVVEAATYEESTTSFASVVRPVVPALKKGAALLILDRVARMELLLRQLAREGVTPSAAAGTAPILVLSTGEALSLAEQGDGHEILEGVWMAPVAWPDDAPETRAFIEAYADHEKRLPGDQALLVYRALSEAIEGARAPSSATLVRVQGGRLVTQTPQISVKPSG
ncbi:MAG: ABC transporter substrate-binding protein [Myxococcales bacterium]|nr:ABC transporter substrate-binding protein [Myxococcales bacterium]